MFEFDRFLDLCRFSGEHLRFAVVVVVVAAVVD